MQHHYYRCGSMTWCPASWSCHLELISQSLWANHIRTGVFHRNITCSLTLIAAFPIFSVTWSPLPRAVTLLLQVPVLPSGSPAPFKLSTHSLLFRPCWLLYAGEIQNNCCFAGNKIAGLSPKTTPALLGVTLLCYVCKTKAVQSNSKLPCWLLLCST